jgi:hypothetical protein
MTEQQWLSSTSPDAMRSLLVERGLWTAGPHSAFGFICHLEAKAHALPYQKLRDEMLVGIIRCIFGNPWRQWHREGNEIWAPLSPSGPGQRSGPIYDNWLTYRDGLVPALARAAVTRECERCEGSGGEKLKYGRHRCPKCKGQGIITGPIDSLRLAVLADALEEAGCTDAGILGHLRQTGEKCSECDGEGCPYCGGPDHDYHEGCCPCPSCSGTGTRPVQHVWTASGGCHVIQLLLGDQQW